MEELARIAAGVDADLLSPDRADVVFAHQDSGCLSFGTEIAGRRWFVKSARTDDARRSLENCIRFHRAVRHPAIVRPVRVIAAPRLTLLYPWMPGEVLNSATVSGDDRGALERFRQRPVDDVQAAITTVIDAHRHVVAKGFVAVDFYDGCLLYDFERSLVALIDLDEYRPGPFPLEADRLPGSLRYMAPEELLRRAVIDERTTVFNLGRMIHHLLDAPTGWRGSIDQVAVVERATAATPSERCESVGQLARAWGRSLSP